MVRTLSQILTVGRVGFAGLLQRKWSSLVLMGSVACVVGVLLSMLSVTAGMLHAYHAGEDADLAIVLAPWGVDFGPAIPTKDVGTILNAPGIAKADAEVVMSVPPNGPYVIGSPRLRGIGE